MESDLILAYVILTAVVFGCVGNLLSLFIFTRPCMTSSVNVLLAGLSAIDLVLLVLVVPVFVLPPMPIWTEETYKVFNAFMLKVRLPSRVGVSSASSRVRYTLLVNMTGAGNRRIIRRMKAHSSKLDFTTTSQPHIHAVRLIVGFFYPQQCYDRFFPRTPGRRPQSCRRETTTALTCVESV